MVHKLALIGFGVVGQGLVEILLNKQEKLQKEEGFEAVVVAISDLMKGSIYHPDGLHLETVLKVLKETGNIENYPDVPGIIKGWDSFKTIRETNADTIVEVSYTDVKTGQPASIIARLLLKAGKMSL